MVAHAQRVQKIPSAPATKRRFGNVLEPDRLIKKRTAHQRAYDRIYEFAPKIAKKSAKVIELLSKEVLERYVSNVISMFIRRSPFLDYFIDAKNANTIQRMLEIHIKMERELKLYERIGGIIIPDSSVLNDEEMVDKEQKATITTLTHSYDYYGRELRLLRDNLEEILGLLRQNKTVGLTVLGPGKDKLSEILNSIKKHGPKVGTLFLVDSNPIALKQASDFARSLYRGPNASWEFTFENFGSGYFWPEEAADQWMTVNLGTTFCNLPADTNFKILDKMHSEFALIGIYLLKDDQSNMQEILELYSGDAMKEQAKKGATILGVNKEDVENKTTYKARFVTVDLSDRYGPGFEKVEYLVAAFDVNEKIETEFGKVYQPGEVIGGFYSVKYTDAQFRALCAQYGYDIPLTVNDDEVRLYMIKKEKH